MKVKELLQELEILKISLQKDSNFINIVENAINVIKQCTSQDIRFESLRKIKKKAETEKLNILTIYCLAATMTNEELIKFSNEILKSQKV